MASKYSPPFSIQNGNRPLNALNPPSPDINPPTPDTDNIAKTRVVSVQKTHVSQPRYLPVEDQLSCAGFRQRLHPFPCQRRRLANTCQSLSGSAHSPPHLPRASNQIVGIPFCAQTLASGHLLCRSGKQLLGLSLRAVRWRACFQLQCHPSSAHSRRPTSIWSCLITWRPEAGGRTYKTESRPRASNGDGNPRLGVVQNPHTLLRSATCQAFAPLMTGTPATGWDIPKSHRGPCVPSSEFLSIGAHDRRQCPLIVNCLVSISMKLHYPPNCSRWRQRSLQTNDGTTTSSRPYSR